MESKGAAHHAGPSFQCFQAAFPVPLQIAALESELMQLMKQNGIQVNNNNSNSAERLSALQQQQHSPKSAAVQARGAFVTGVLSVSKFKEKFVFIKVSKGERVNSV